jgi:hypothetical protein
VHFRDATSFRIRQADRTGGAVLPGGHEKGRDLRIGCEFFRPAFPSQVRDACGPRWRYRIYSESRRFTWRSSTAMRLGSPNTQGLFRLLRTLPYTTVARKRYTSQPTCRASVARTRDPNSTSRRPASSLHASSCLIEKDFPTLA